MNKYQEFSEKSFLRIFVNHNFQVDFRDSSINSFCCKTDVITGRRATEATIDFFHAPSQLVIAALREKKGGGGLPTTVKSGEIGDSSYIYYAGTETYYALGTENRRGKATKIRIQYFWTIHFKLLKEKTLALFKM